MPTQKTRHNFVIPHLCMEQGTYGTATRAYNGIPQSNRQCYPEVITQFTKYMDSWYLPLSFLLTKYRIDFDMLDLTTGHTSLYEKLQAPV